MVYLDNNATTRPFAEVVELVARLMKADFPNPSSAIGDVWGLPRKIASEKRRIASLLKAETSEQIVCTSGATESNNLAIVGGVRGSACGRHIVASAIEHPSVLETVNALAQEGCDVTLVGVSSEGLVNPEDVQRAVRPDTAVVSVMWANNETGVIQPIPQLAAAARKSNPQVLFHTDATQAVGKAPINLEEAGDVDLLSFSAHKFHGPKGIGGLFVRSSHSVQPLLHGGGQQGGLRPGTENLPLLAGMALALELATARILNASLGPLWTDFAESVAIPGAFLVAANAPRLRNTKLLCLPGLDGASLVDFLSLRGIATSTGSACNRGTLAPSHVLAAMGMADDLAKSCLRISINFENTSNDLRMLIEALCAFAAQCGNREC